MNKKTLLWLAILWIVLVSVASGYASNTSIETLPGNRANGYIDCSGSTVTCIGRATINTGTSYKMTVTLQRLSSDNGWINIASVTSRNTVESSFSLPVSSGTYRTRVSIMVFDEDGVIIDKCNSYSKTIVV